MPCPEGQSQEARSARAATPQALLTLDLRGADDLAAGGWRAAPVAGRMVMSLASWPPGWGGRRRVAAEGRGDTGGGWEAVRAASLTLARGPGGAGPVT